MRADTATRALLLVLVLAGFAPPVPAQQDFDTSWIDWDLVDAGEVVVRTDKLDRGGVSIDVAIAVHASREAIWAILTACEIAPEYVPNVLDCVLIDSINNGRSELFIQTVKPAFFVPKFEHVFRLDYFPPDRIDVHRVSGPIEEMEGVWRLLPHGDATLLTHSLHVRPGMPIPRLFVRATLKHDLPIVLRAVRQRAEGRPPAD